MKNLKYHGNFILIAVAACLFSCRQEKKTEPIVSEETAVAPGLPAPFRFHKGLEIKPGLTFDVTSWGRGSESTGAYLILRSDSAHLEYRTAGGNLDGEITDAWNMDMDSDGNPEIFIQAQGKGEGSYLTMYVYEFTSSGASQQLRFPELTSSTKKSYRGMDSVYVKDGKLYRDFPLFKEGDAAGKPSGGKKNVEYTLRNNSFSVKELADGTSK